MATQKKKDNCAICFEETADTIKCGHYFHPECIKPWADEYNSCPICKKPVDKTKPVKKFGYKSDTTGDGQMARHFLEQMVDDADSMFLDPVQALLAAAIMGNSHGLGLHPAMSGIIFFDERYSPRPHHPYPREENDQFLVSCAKCGAGLRSENVYINCRYCGDYFYCSDHCAEVHDHKCPRRPEMAEVPTWTCAECDQRPCMCDDELPELVCETCGEAGCMRSLHGD